VAGRSPHVARDLGVPLEMLCKDVRQLDADQGLRPDPPIAAEREGIKQQREETTTCDARRDPQRHQRAFATELEKPNEVNAFNAQYRESHGVEPVRCVWTSRRPRSTSGVGAG